MKDEICSACSKAIESDSPKEQARQQTCDANNSTCNCKEPAYDHRGWCAACDKWMHQKLKLKPSALTSRTYEIMGDKVTMTVEPKPKPPKDAGARELKFRVCANECQPDVDWDDFDLAPGKYHVIEYAAYEKALAKANWEEDIAKAQAAQFHEMRSAYEKLEQDLADLQGGYLEYEFENKELRKLLKDEPLWRERTSKKYLEVSRELTQERLKSAALIEALSEVTGKLLAAAEGDPYIAETPSESALDTLAKWGKE